MMPQTMLTSALLPVAAAAAGLSTPEAWSALDRASAAACTSASGLSDVQIGPPIRFSDRAGMDVRELSGRWPQPHMRGREAEMICLFDRRSQRAEVQEAQDDEEPIQARIISRNWRLVSINGAAPPSTRPVTLLLGGDGRVSGNSGCNSFNGRFVLDGTSLRIIPPLSSTRRGCEPAAMNVERRLLDALPRSRNWSIGRRDTLIISLAGGGSLHFRAQ